jgi:hypothetical protein
MSGFKVFALLGLSIEDHKGPLCPLLSPNFRKLLLNIRLDVVRRFLECSHPDDAQKLLIFCRMPVVYIGTNPTLTIRHGCHLGMSGLLSIIFSSIIVLQERPPSP